FALGGSHLLPLERRLKAVNVGERVRALARVALGRRAVRHRSDEDVAGRMRRVAVVDEVDYGFERPELVRRSHHCTSPFVIWPCQWPDALASIEGLTVQSSMNAASGRIGTV